MVKVVAQDPLRYVLYVDLTRKTFWVEDRSDLFDKWIGGVGVATQLLKEELKKDADPLSPDNVIVLAVGPFTSIFPIASKTVTMFKSPLTGNLGESHAGGRSAIAIRHAGYGAIVIKGASNKPVYIAIYGNNKVAIKDASTLWGMRSSITVGRVIAENEPDAGYRSILRIGRGGEKLVYYSSVITETLRHFGRLGLGAVFGSKKLKAIFISGKRELPIKDKKLYKEVYKELYSTMVESDLMKKYHDIGTSVNVLPLNELGALPTRNLQQSRFEYAENISGEYFAQNLLGRRVACSHCPIGCIHLAALREPYEDEPYFYKTTFISYDYEPIYALGSMLGVGRGEDVLKLIDLVEINGLDAMSTGVVLAWATEAYQRGLISDKETLLELEWGRTESYLKAINYIIEQPNEFYRDLAKGAYHASRKYGGEEFALTFGKNEMPGYSTGPAAYVGYAIGARHSHLDNAGYSYDQKKIGSKIDPQEMVKDLIKEESWRQILNSLVICLFARKVFKPNIISKAFKSLGKNHTEKDLEKIGEEIYKEKYKLKIQLGFKTDEIKFPKRIFETTTPHGKITKKFMEESIKAFKQYLEQAIAQEK